MKTARQTPRFEYVKHAVYGERWAFLGANGELLCHGEWHRDHTDAKRSARRVRTLMRGPVEHVYRRRGKR